MPLLFRNAVALEAQRSVGGELNEIKDAIPYKLVGERESAAFTDLNSHHKRGFASLCFDVVCLYKRLLPITWSTKLIYKR